MKRKLFLHVGAPKCASTSIQNFLFANANLLGLHGYEIANEQLVFGHGGNNPLWFFEDARDAEQGREKVSEKLSLLMRNGIVSAENLWTPDMCALFEPGKFEYHILFVVRRQDNWIYSAWQQWSSKAGISLEDMIETALSNHDPDFVGAYEAWCKLAGRSNVTVLCLDVLDRAIEDVVLDWLSIDEKRGEFVRSFNPLNVSLDFRISDLLSRYLMAGGGHDLRIEEALAMYCKLAFANRYRLPNYLSKRIMKRFHRDNVTLFGSRCADQIRNAKDISRLSVFPRDDELAQDYLLACLLETIGALSADVQSLRTTVDHLYLQLRQSQNAAE